MQKEILQHYKNIETSEESKTRGTKRANDKLTRYTITQNIKKIHKHIDVK